MDTLEIFKSLKTEQEKSNGVKTEVLNTNSDYSDESDKEDNPIPSHPISSQTISTSSCKVSPSMDDDNVVCIEIVLYRKQKLNNWKMKQTRLLLSQKKKWLFAEEENEDNQQHQLIYMQRELPK